MYEKFNCECGVKETKITDEGLVVEFAFIFPGGDEYPAFSYMHTLLVKRLVTGGWALSFDFGFPRELKETIKSDCSFWADHAIHVATSNPSIRVRAAVLGLLQK